ncbi:Serine/threonine-protein kinase AfsK [Actinomadura rubteroloni]|uniref:Serine/threonine-protein kinase AfsK n=1 Tax=Actinomadura rubteroloni TaxID=1926885 RepID=A0A2P4UQH1_9ACTN|nr:serine/threonine-protein kinase [Actinomadura rubteroloni]POM27279.1 Serine/threonine-protein kinase AfsK [Actinomadura rubteroloni]
MPDAHPLRAGDPGRLGGYEVLGRLGEGGQGAVFLGRRAGATDGDYVAVKLLHADLSGDDTARSRFVRELAVAKRVARFCTAQVLDADVAGDQPYIVSEYVPGQSLHRLVQQDGPRSGGALERLAISTLTALTAIHQAGIVHRDLKPHNVMMGPDGPRVIDFGVARALGAAGETQNVGTPAYMAPEHFTGAPVGPAADMFAWGTTMVFAANGRPAFGNDDLAAVMHRILTGEPDLGALPEPLRSVVTACLAKEPERRPSAREAQERLVGAASGNDVPAPPPPFPFAPPEPPAAVPSGGALPGVTDPATRPGPPGPVPATGAGRRKIVRLAPVFAGAAVAAVLAGGAVWAATGRGGDEGGPSAATSQDGQATGGSAATATGAGRATTRPTAAGRTPKARPSDGPRTPDGKKPKRGPGGRPSATATGGGGGGGSRPAPEPPNKYTARQACGSGYGVLRTMAVSGGTAYLLYSSATGKNCAVTMKTSSVGKKSPVSVWLQKQGGSQVTDSGSYAWYAGPVYVAAKNVCVRFGGNGRTSGWGNCGS